MAGFDPVFEVITPTASSGPDHLGTVRIDLDGRRVHVQFYGNGRLRFRVHESPMLVDECYLGGTGQDTIIGVRPA